MLATFYMPLSIQSTMVVVCSTSVGADSESTRGSTRLFLIEAASVATEAGAFGGTVVLVTESDSPLLATAQPSKFSKNA